MVSKLVQTCIASVVLKTTANLVIQLVNQKGETHLPSIDTFRLFQFALFGLLSAPVNSFWQQLLERSFPTRKTPQTNDADARASKDTGKALPGPQSHADIEWVNVFTKLALDQLIGLFVMNTIFLSCMNIGNWYDPPLVIHDIQQKVFSITKAGWKIWPMVALTNFIFVPTDMRVIVASCVGFGWNMFLSLF
ncbi:putative peroxisomal membrane protein 2, pxmp2 [Aaosphaeria arxii CBS 175.79]|uniref:Putative peroxisomal membrane protein 2, pxmp2 n=1 Tax=Aaosphaeria arxii CBS 175.79 TaxID=1450172 RepID=A0A6A5Y0U9_9PLEO|nr:putative peroxisomal membrane protein 2, pxmp2 [Aaosphaeria arxii CBS 175.79]KAF2018184.1 putative peroxisomal membrane protein 2, pxmp2 [Aaosphaeria arxii CBS 175.79]